MPKTSKSEVNEEKRKANMLANQEKMVVGQAKMTAGQDKMADFVAEVVDLLMKQAGSNAAQISANYQAYSSVALIATLQVGFGLTNFAEAKICPSTS